MEEIIELLELLGVNLDAVDVDIYDLDVYSNFGLVLDCIDQFSPTYDFINEAIVTNKSPYRGEVND